MDFHRTNRDAYRAETAYYRSGRRVEPLIFDRMGRAAQNAEYDKHNPGRRHSTDRNERMYGSCGCGFCITYRDNYMAQLQAPVNERNAGMGSVNICDRCPSMVKGVALGAIQIRTSSDPDSSEVITKELCPACVAELVAMLEFTPEDRPQKAYDKPYKRESDAGEFNSATAEQLAAALFEKLMKENRVIESGK